jgi:hypothetical protein
MRERREHACDDENDVGEKKVSIILTQSISHTSGEIHTSTTSIKNQPTSSRLATQIKMV